VGAAVVRGAAQGAWDYGRDGSCQHNLGGYLGASASGAAQGAIPWDQILKTVHPE
jgi:hypothetical protein